MKTRTKVIIGLVAAAILWFIMFSPWTAPLVNFWYTMTFSAIVLTTLATCFCREWLNDIHICWQEVVSGLAIAFVLWWIFWIGDKVS